jgi:cation transport ATPase
MIWSILHEWVLQPQYLTAWLQALATLVALGISAWAVLRQGAMERRRNRQEMNTLALSVCMACVLALTAVSRAILR